MRSAMTAVLVLVLSLPGLSATKKLLFEDLTGAWCGYCPGAVIEIDSLHSLYPNNVIFVSHHCRDSMENPFSVIMTNKAPFFPSVMVNRRKVGGPSHKDIFAYENEIKTSPFAPVAVEIASTWDKPSRKITGTITARFDSVPASGDLRIGLMVIEDNVVGSGSGYDQSNAYAFFPGYPQLKILGHPIKGYKHRMVQRDCPLGIYGQSGHIPSPPKINTAYTIPFTYTVPVQYNNLDVVTGNLSLVAFVQRIKSTDSTILNSGIAKVVQVTPVLPAMIRIDESVRPEVRAYHDHISLFMPRAGVYDVSLVSPAGRVVFAMPGAQLGGGVGAVSISTGKLPSGVYVLSVRGTAAGTATRVYVGR